MTPSITTSTFKRIKEYVLKLKEATTQAESCQREIVISHAELQKHLADNDPQFNFTASEMSKAVEHLASHGYVRILRNTSGLEAILLAPDLLTNLAASFVLEARRNPEESGALDEGKLLRGEYDFPELANLSLRERELLLNAVTALFLGRNICFRETLGNRTLLVFPALINQKQPVSVDQETVDDVSYIVTGALQNVYASLVVLLGYTSTFTRTDHWQNQAQYEMDPGEICGFRQIDEREGQVEFVLYYGKATPDYTRSLFEGLFEKFLRARNVKVTKYPALDCPKCGYRQQRAEVAKRIKKGDNSLFCTECAERILLPKLRDTTTAVVTTEIDRQTKVADDRTFYETGVARLKSIVREREKAPTCFISYAWGDADHAGWVLAVATDLRNAGIDVHLDRWENDIGTSIPLFVAKIEKSDFIAVVGTPSYKQKYENKVAGDGTIVAAEMGIIDVRMIATEERKKTVLPLLRKGEEHNSLPPLLHGRVYADFRKDEAYFSKLFDLLLTLYAIPPDAPALVEVDEWRHAADLLARAR